MSRKARSKDEDFGLKKSSGVNYGQVLDRQIDDDRFERQRAIRVGAAPAPAAPQASSSGGVKKPPAQSATMDAFMRMVTGKEERTIADRISDPNRPTWEQYKKENADKLDLFSGNEEKEMIEYRKKLDAAREKALARRSGASSKKKKKRSHSSSESDSDSDGDRRRSKKKSGSRKKKKSRKRRRSSSSSNSESGGDSSESEKESSRKKHKHKSKKKKKSKDRDRSPSPVRLSSFFNGGGSSDEDN
ncbi:Beta-glucosidase 30 [Globisporangium polare]